MRLIKSISAITFLIIFSSASLCLADTYLIWDPCDSPSADSLSEIFNCTDYNGVITNDINAYLNELENYKPIFVFAEWWCDGFDWDMLDDIQGDLYAYLMNGGSIYWEGENTAFCHPFYRDSLFMFDIATCATEPFVNLRSCDSGPFNVELNIIPTLAEMIGWADGCAFEGEDLCWCKAVYRETHFKGLLTTFPIANLTDNGRNTRVDFINEIMGWLAPAMSAPDNSVEIPAETASIKAYPNPFNTQTKIMYDVPQAGHLKIRIYNILGQPVKTLLKGYKDVGKYDLIWDSGNYAAGIYFARLESNLYSDCTKLISLK
jgi:hypothetical protein